MEIKRYDLARMRQDIKEDESMNKTGEQKASQEDIKKLIADRKKKTGDGNA